jgi:hypothetical protein
LDSADVPLKPLRTPGYKAPSPTAAVKKSASKSTGKATASAASAAASASAATAAPIPPVRAVSPLREEARSQILTAMSRIQISPRPGAGAAWTEKVVAAALERSKVSRQLWEQQEQQAKR